VAKKLAIAAGAAVLATLFAAGVSALGFPEVAGVLFMAVMVPAAVGILS
jgi:hypothetical protein